MAGNSGSRSGSAGAVKMDLSGRPLTYPMRRWVARFGTLPNQRKIAEAAGLLTREVSYVFAGTRFNPRVQDAVAEVAGMTAVELFGAWAWPRRGGRRIRRMMRQAG